jgi:hypothetical protein
VWLLGKLERHLSAVVFAIVMKLPTSREQKGLGRFIKNFKKA